VWVGRVEPKFKDRAPHVVRLPEEGDWWFCDGHKLVGAFAGAQTGRRFEEPEKLTRADVFENVRPGGYIPEEHIKDMDADGVDIGLIYPTVGLLLYGLSDGELLTAVFRAYNDWIAEFCKPFPKRLKGIAMLNIDDVQEGVKELERCAKMGLAGAMITVYPLAEKPYDSPEYEPLWAAAQDLGMPLSLHVGTNRPGPEDAFVDLESIPPAFLTNVDHWVRMSLAQLIFGGVFERHPKLQAGSIEHELSWVIHFLDRLDYNYIQRPPTGGRRKFKEDMLPSDYFHRHVFLSFQDDALGVKLRDIIGVDNLLWGSDYPHPETTFPRSRQVLEDILVDCAEEEKAKIAGGNAARIYHFE
jgi:predicted TIM-barrel fold metal-dependent hydrolase